MILHIKVQLSHHVNNAMLYFQSTGKQAGDAFQAELCFALMEVAHTSTHATEQCCFDVTQ